jgi:RNA polymerase sigma factor (sigma-70 family)
MMSIPGKREAAPKWPGDAALIARCRAGDESAWETLIMRYRRLIYSIPAKYRIPSWAADNIFQQVALKLFEQLPRIRKVDNIAGWLATTTRRDCLLFLREQQRRLESETEPDDLAVDPPDLAEALEDVRSRHALALAFERLDEPSRQLLSALYVEEPKPSYEEIARRLGRPIWSLGPTRRRCLDKLRKLYNECADNLTPAKVVQLRRPLSGQSSIKRVAGKLLPFRVGAAG